jgi:hypothetical protein
LRSFEDLGFATVFDGVADYGSFANVSTQAVFEMMKHVEVGANLEGSSVVEIGKAEVEAFNIPRNEMIVSGTDLNKCFVNFVFFFL